MYDCRRSSLLPLDELFGPLPGGKLRLVLVGKVTAGGTSLEGDKGKLHRGGGALWTGADGDS